MTECVFWYWFSCGVKSGVIYCVEEFMAHTHTYY